MTFDCIELFILIHKFYGNLKDAMVGVHEENFISGSILTYDYCIVQIVFEIPFSLCTTGAS